MSDRKVVKNEERAKTIAAYKQAFKTPAGKLVLEDLKRSFGGKTFDVETNTSFYKQGQRSVVDLITEAIEE